MAIDLKDRSVKLQEKVENPETDAHDKVNLSGSLAAVTFLGLFIIITWLGVWTLFMIR